MGLFWTGMVHMVIANDISGMRFVRSVIAAGVTIFLITVVGATNDLPLIYDAKTRITAAEDTPVQNSVSNSLLAVDTPFLNEEPLQLLRPGKGQDRLEINETVLAMLSASEEPIAIVGIVGPYHGGKSFLLNVLLNSTHGFPVGAKPEPETRGIWIRVVSKHKLRGVDGSRVILLDTEGFYGERATRLYDARIFAIATLLSSHLVYNTLRTLGDTQSVSALADLAKQAQVFNLQNWLHTSDMTSDETFLTANVDPSLLLKTLDFPPLTWVVQGFDMDLESSHTPMEYLQRYLSAYAHTGDRTLDTLFTKGISCYALRTPADLNVLREQYGGKILAADEELFSQLHPGYLSDLKRLREGIFGNLSAKGGGHLTRKTLSSLLPLLVHYVNEDFPLHAERKLRDILVDIMVDSAFSGGVEYFQKCMHESSLVDSVVSARRILGMRDRSAISTLAASALTAEELEEVMNTAELRAIDYCKQRCVGVPQQLMVTSCNVQLGMKLNNMKPSFREENERKVREVLVRLGEDLFATAGKKILEVKLPIPENILQQTCQDVLKDALHRYEVLVGPHKGSHLYYKACAQMQQEVDAKCEKVSRINGEKISSILSAAKALFRNEYEHAYLATRNFASDSNNLPSSVEESLREANGKPISYAKLEDMHAAHVKTAEIAFDKAVKDALPWMASGNELYDFYHFQCLQWLKQRYTEIQAFNSMLIREFCENTVTLLTLQSKTQASSVTPFPDNDETISEKAEDIAKHVMQEYVQATKDYASLSVVEEKRKELARNIVEVATHLLKKNTALMAAFCYDPLMDAYKELHMQDCERTFHNLWVSRSFWSHKCLWPGPRYMFGFKYAAYKAARRHLDKAQASSDTEKPSSNHEIAKGVKLSAATRNKVIQAWIEHDLAPHANVVFVNFTILAACCVVIVSAILWAFKMAGSGRSQHKFQGEDSDAWHFYTSPTRLKTEEKASMFSRGHRKNF